MWLCGLDSEVPLIAELTWLKAKVYGNLRAQIDVVEAPDVPTLIFEASRAIWCLELLRA